MSCGLPRPQMVASVCRRNYQQVAEQDDLGGPGSETAPGTWRQFQVAQTSTSIKRFQSAEDWGAAVPMRQRPWWPLNCLWDTGLTTDQLAEAGSEPGRRRPGIRARVRRLGRGSWRATGTRGAAGRPVPAYLSQCPGRDRANIQCSGAGAAQHPGSHFTTSWKEDAATTANRWCAGSVPRWPRRWTGSINAPKPGYPAQEQACSPRFRTKARPQACFGNSRKSGRALSPGDATGPR